MAFSERTHCPICKGTSATQLIRMPMDSGPAFDYLKTRYEKRISASALAHMEFILMHCQDCRTVWQKHILDDADLNLLYDEWIDPEQSLARKRHVSPSARLTFARLCAQIAALYPSPETRVLDFGMGWGDWLKMATAFGFQTDGLETSARRIAHVRQQCLNTVRPEEIAPETYHFINAEQVFEHLPTPTASMHDCLCWLKPGGTLRISVPDGTFLVKALARQQWTIAEMATRPLEHINIFTAQSLRRMAIEGGFEVVAPPLVLPMVGPNWQQIKAFIGIGIRDAALRFNIGLRTTIWLRKSPP